MRRDVHLDIGTRVINAKTGKLGTVAEPHYLARPDPHEICIHYDDMSEESSTCDDRHDIEYKGNGSYEEALVRWGHVTRKDYVPGAQVFHLAERLRGMVIADEYGACGIDDVLVQLAGRDGTVTADWRMLRIFDYGK